MNDELLEQIGMEGVPRFDSANSAQGYIDHLTRIQRALPAHAVAAKSVGDLSTYKAVQAHIEAIPVLVAGAKRQLEELQEKAYRTRAAELEKQLLDTLPEKEAVEKLELELRERTARLAARRNPILMELSDIQLYRLGPIQRARAEREEAAPPPPAVNTEDVPYTQSVRTVATNYNSKVR